LRRGSHKNQSSLSNINDELKAKSPTFANGFQLNRHLTEAEKFEVTTPPKSAIRSVASPQELELSKNVFFSLSANRKQGSQKLEVAGEENQAPFVLTTAVASVVGVSSLENAAKTNDTKTHNKENL